MKSFLSRILKSTPKQINTITASTFKSQKDSTFKVPSSNLENLRLVVDSDPLSSSIFSHITKQAKIVDDDIKIDQSKVSIFIPLDDFLVYTFFPDEDFSMTDSPKLANYDYSVDFPNLKTNCYIYLRPNFYEFVEYLKEHYNLILYCKGDDVYNDTILKIIDPEGKLFNHKYYGQNHCHLMFNEKEDIIEYLRDINIFPNISLKKKILVEAGSSFSEILSPDNIISITPFNPDEEYDNPGANDAALNEFTIELENAAKCDDVRIYTKKTYNMRNILISSKLI